MVCEGLFLVSETLSAKRCLHILFFSRFYTVKMIHYQAVTQYSLPNQTIQICNYQFLSPLQSQSPPPFKSDNEFLASFNMWQIDRVLCTREAKALIRKFKLQNTVHHNLPSLFLDNLKNLQASLPCMFV